MAVDVIIDPLTGQIYWNDSQGTAQSIAISGNGTDLIKTVGYSLQFSAAPAGTITTGSATTAVSGSGTNFLTLFGSGAAGSGAVLYTSQGTSIGTISTVSSDTALSLQANASGSYTGITFRYSPPAGTDRLILSDSSTPIYPATTGANLGTSSYRWSLYASLGDITNSGTTAINLMLDKSGIGSTESPALQFINTTAATSGAQYQFAPWNEFRGKAWNTGSLASNDVRMRMGMAALSGNTPTSEFVIASSVDTGTASWYYPLTLNATANDSVLYLNNGVISIGKLLTNGTTSSYALELYNYNLATSGQTANWSPAFEMNGSAWNTSTATSNILRFRSEVQTTSGNPISGSIFWKSAITTSYSATPSFSNNLSLSNTNGLGLWNANTAASYLKASGSQASDIVYTFPASAPTTNQVLSASSVSGSSITLTWSTSASGSGTVNSGASGKVAYYPSLGTAVDDATALDYSTTSPHLTVTAQATTAIPLKLVGIASQSVDLFQVATSGANVFTVGSAGISTFANSTAASGTTSGALIITGGIGVGSTSYLSTTNITTLTLTNALAVGQGGTGTSTAPNQWGVIFATSTSQYNSTAAGSADQVLKSGGGTGAPSFGAINLASSNAVSNTLALSNGGLGTTTFTQNGVLYGNAATSILVTSASGAAGAILQTTTSGGVPSFSTTLPGTYSFSSSTAASSTTVAAVVFSGGIGVGSTSYLSDLYTVGTILSATSATTVSISTSAATKTINIGIGGTSSHTTTITIGTTAGTSTLTIESPTVATNTTSLTLFNANATTVNAFGAATTLTLGATTGTGTIRNVTIDFPNATTISGSTGLATVFSAANPASLAVFGAATTATIFGSATSLTLGAATGTASIRNTTVTLTNATVVNINGNDPVIQASTTGTVTLFNTSNATVNAFGAATALTLGATTGTATIRNTTATFSNATVFNINGNDPVIQASTTGTVTLFNTSNATVNAFGAATALTLGATTGTATIRNTTATFSNATVVNINGNDPTIQASTTGTVTLFNTSNATVNAFGAATAMTLGAATGTASIRNTTVTLTNATVFNINGNAPVIQASTTGTVTLFNTSNTTVNAFGAATALNMGSSAGTATLANATVTFSNATTVNVNGNAPVIQASTTGTVTLFNTSNTTVNAFGAATALNMGSSAGTATIANATVTFSNAATVNINGNAPVIQASTTGTVTLFNTSNTTVNAFGAATALNMGSSAGTATIANATVTFSNAATVNINGNAPVIQASTTGTVTLFNTSNTTVNAFGAATALTLGATTGTTTIRNTTVALTNATSITGTSAAITMFGESTTFTLMGTTAASTTNIATGNNGANAKILNLATGGAGAGASNVNVGVATGTFTVNSATSNIGTTAVSGVVAILSSSFTANNATTFSATSATSLSLGASTGTATIGNTTFTLTNATSITGTSAAITMFGESTTFTLMATTATSTTNIATGNNGTNAKTLNLATGGAGAGASNVNVGVSTGTFTVNSATSNIGTTAVSGTVAVLSSSFTANNATTFSATSATTLSLGASTGTATIGNTTFTLTNATSITGTSAAITMFGESTSFTLLGTTATSTINIATGNNGTNAKTLNLATGGAGAGNSNINIGVSTGTTSVKSSTFDLANATSITGSASLATVFATANPASLALFGAATTLVIGSTAGTITIANSTATFSGATANFSANTAFNLGTSVTGASSINIGTGAVAGAIKAINIGTGGSGTGTSTIIIGTTSGTSTITLNGVTTLSSALAVGSGGTGTSTAPTQWGVIFATSSSAYNSTAAGSTNQWIRAVTSGAPTWSTATLATTYASGDLLYASSSNTVGGLTSTATSVLITQGAAAPSWLQGATGNRLLKTSGSAISWGQVDLASGDVTGTLPVGNGGTGQTTYTDGQLLIGNTTGNTLTKATLTPGTNISITNGNGSITINATSSGSGTVNSGAAGKIAYYPTATTTVDDAAALDYSTTTTHLTITAQGASTSPLELVGAASQTANFLNVKNSAGTSLISFATTSSGSGAKLLIQGTSSNQDDLLRIENSGTYTITGGYAGQRGLRVVYRTNGNNTADRYFWSISRGYDGFGFFNFGCDETTGVGLTIGSASEGFPLSAKVIEDATTDTVKDVINIERTTSGTAAAGIGGRISFRQEHAGGTLVNTIGIDGLLSNAGSTTYVGALSIKTNSAGTTTLSERVRIDNTSVQLSPIGTSAGNTNELRFLELAATGSNYIAFKAPDSIATNYTYVLPDAAPSAGQLLSASAPSGGVVTLSWATDQLGTSGGGITSLNALTAASQSFANDTNVTITSATATHTLGWQGTLAVGRGGTGTSTTPTQWGVAYGLSASALAYTGAGASGQLLLAVTSNAPQWGTMSGDASIGNTGVVTIANSAVTFAKMQNSAAAGLSVIGRSTNSAGAFAEIATTTDGAVLRLSGTTLGFGSINLATTNAVTGILPVGNGGTGTSTAPTQWGITFATSASQYASTAAGSTNQWIRAVTSGAPTWSTATLATTYAAGDLLYASAGNTVGGLTSTATSVLITQGAAGPSWLQGATGNRLLKTSGSAISWGQVDLASGDVTGTLAVGSGGTGTSSFAINTILTSGASTTGAVTTATALAYSASSQHLTITAQGAATSPLRLVGTTSQTADLFQVFSTSAGTLLGSVGAFGGATFTSLATSATTPATALVVTGAAHTALNTATEYSDAYFNFGQTKTFTSGAITTLRTFRVAPATYAFSGASTVTNAATLQIDGAPTAGTNATLTEAAALRILTGTASGKGLVIRGSTSQTGNFIDVQNNSGTSLVTLGTTNINLAPHGASAGNTFELRFSELAATGSNYIAFKAPDDIATTYTYVLPSAAPSAGQLLSASAPSAGVVTLSWATDQLGTSGGGITSLGGLTAASQSFANDTNVTITSATATHTLGWQGELAISRGGTGTSTAPTQWGVMFATSTTAIRSTAAAGSTNQWLASVSAGAPVWSTATLATTYAAGDLLYASAGNVVGGLTSTATSVLITQGAAAPSWLQGATGNRLLKTSGSAISWGQVDLASGDVTGTLAIGGGGTGTSTAPTQWGVMFATSASAIRSTAAPASTNQLLAGVSGGAPVWSTATFATTYLIGQFLYASGANAVSGLATTTFSVDTTNVRIGIGTSAASTPLHVLNAGTGTNAVVVMDTIDVQSTATPAAGFGGSILFDLESSTTTGQDAASIETVWATATHATRLAELNFKTNDVNTSTLTERMSISNITTGQSSTNATVIITGTLGVNSTSYLSSLSLNTALAIGSGGTNTSSFATTNGLVYFNGTNLLTTNAAASGIVVTSGGNVPSVATDIPTAVTIGSGYIYRGGGTDVPLADGGTNASLTANQGGVIYSTASAMAINTPGSSGQPLLSGGTGAPTFGTLGMGAGGTGLTTTAPGANYILGMNSGNSGLEYKQLVQGSNITITHAANQVTITASGGSATAGGSDTQIQYNNATALAGISNFTFASNLVSLTNATNFANTSTPGMQLKYNTAAGTTTVNNNSPALDFIGRIYASAADRHARIRQEIQTTAATPSHALVWSSSYDTGTASYTRVLSVHSVDGLGFWNYAGTPGSAANYFKTGNQASDIRYTWPTTAPTTNQVLSATTVSGSDITLGWATAGGGAGTVGSGTINQLAYYSGATTTASDASLVRAATGTHLTITAQGASTSPLKVVGAASQSAALFTVATSGADVLVVGSGGAITTGTWNGTAIGVLYGGTGQTTYTDGQLLIGNSTGNTLTKATLTAGSGVAVTNGSGSITVRQKRPLTLTFCSGFTPAATGADSVVLRIPDSPADGSTSLTYNLRELFLRVETPSAGTSTVQVEYYTGTAAFSATNLLSTALSATGAAAYEFASTGFSTSTLASGTKLRLNFTAINATHANFFIQLLLEEN